MPPVAAELSWLQVHAFRLTRHHLLKRVPNKDLVPVVGDIGGVQAQVMSAAELQIGVRVNSTVKDVRTALWMDKTLVKTWLMRGTLHLVPAPGRTSSEGEPQGGVDLGRRARRWPRRSHLVSRSREADAAYRRRPAQTAADQSAP